MSGIKGMQGSGGKREGAGRKPKEEKTTTIAFRVPETHAERLKELVKITIDKYLKKR